MDGPGVILYDENGIALAVLDGITVPPSTSGLLLMGVDSGTSRYLFVDSAGRPSVISDQLPATLVGGRLDINTGSWLGSTAPTVGQKIMDSSLPVVIASDQTVNIFGTVLVTPNSEVSVQTLGALNDSCTIDVFGPTILLIAGGSGGNLVGTLVAEFTIDGFTWLPARFREYLTGAFHSSLSGTFNTDVAYNIDLPNAAVVAKVSVSAYTSGSTPVEVRSSDVSIEPIVVRVDPTGTTAQPVTDNSGSLTIDSTQLPAALVGGRLDENVGSWFGSTAPTVGQKTSANSIPIVIAIDQPTVPVSDGGGSLTVDGTVTAIVRGGAKGATAAADLTSTAEGADHQSLDVQIYHGGTAINPTAIRALTNADVVSAEVTKWVGSTAPTVGQKVSASSLPVVIASDQTAVTVTANIGTTGTLALDATLTGGTAKAIVRGGTKGATTPADITSTAEGTDHQSLDVQIYHGGAAKDPTQIRALTNADVITSEVSKWIGSTAPTVGQKTMANSIPVAIASDQTAVAISAASLPLPTGAALDATLTGGTAKAIVRGGAKGATVAADVTSTAEGADHQSLDVQIYHGGTAKDPTAIRALTNSDIVTAAQGTAASASGAWTAKVTDGTTVAAVKAASTAVALTDPALVVAVSPNGPFIFGGDSRLRVGQETILLFDTFEGASLNTITWSQSQLGMAQAVATGGLTLNSGSSLTSGNYSILNSVRSIRSTVEFGLYVQLRVKTVPQTNAVLEFGWGAVATTSAPTNGAFFRIPSSGVLQGVINNGGTEVVTQLAVAGALSASNYYNFEITIFEDSVLFDVESPDRTVNISTSVPITSTFGSPTASATLPTFARVYNSGATSSAAQLVVGNVAVTQLDSGPNILETSSVTSVSGSASNVTLLAANPNRQGVMIHNDSTAILRVKLGATASLTSFTARLLPQGYYEVPLFNGDEPWRGQIDGIWESAAGSARITEVF